MVKTCSRAPKKKKSRKKEGVPWTKGTNNKNWKRKERSAGKNSARWQEAANLSLQMAVTKKERDRGWGRGI